MQMLCTILKQLQAEISKLKPNMSRTLLPIVLLIKHLATIYNYIKDLTKTKTIPSTITLDQTCVYQ